MKKLSERFMYYAGLIACSHPKAVEDLKHIQNLIDAEEQGLLLRLPCKVGTTVYFIDEKIEKKGRKNVSVSFGDIGGVDHITLGGIMKPVYTVCNEKNEWFDFYEEDFGKTVFLTKAEAEKKLAEMGCE